MVRFQKFFRKLSAAGTLHQFLRKGRNLVPERQRLQPCLRQSRLAIERTGNLAVDGPRGVRIVAEVHRGQAAVAEIVGAVEGPERRFQRLHDVAGPANLRRVSVFEGAGRDRRHLGVQWLFDQRPGTGQ